VPLRRVLDGDEVIADPADVTKRADCLGGILEQGLLECRAPLWGPILVS
jgi:hypothetical protein